MAIADSIQANKGLCLVSLMIILLQLTSVYVLCDQHENGRYFGIIVSGLMSYQQYFRCINLTYHEIVLPM